MKNPLRTTAAIIAAVFFCAPFAQRSSAATTNVIVGLGGFDVFSPSVVNISPNDSVVWIWTNTFHSTTSGTNGVHGDDNGVPSGLWDSGVIGSLPFSFTNTFTTAGAFSYYCKIHYFVGMTGQVLVGPSITITNPLNGTVFATPANVAIQAAVISGRGNVTNVQFLLNNALLASENSGPFSTIASNLAAGNYTLSAIAQDDGGLSATNAVGISVINPMTVMLMNSSRPSGTNFQFSYSADVGLNYVVQRSADLIGWIPLITNTAASNPVVFDDSNATNSLDFYRVGRLPNP
jgi:plastocyanin